MKSELSSLPWRAAFVLTGLVADPCFAQDKSALAPSRLHLPKGPGSIEGIGENVEPNLNMGLVAYAVSIETPAGYAGIVPSLRLVYNSGAGNSEVGLGWSLPVPSIERMTVHGLPRYDSGDVIAANGSDELVRVSAAGVYRARIESGFVRYTWIDAAADGKNGYFKAEYPDGRVGYFGATADGGSVASAVVQGTEGTFRWHLVELVDPLGHRIRYEYGKDGAASQLTRIRYVFDAEGKAKYEIDLDYETRPDQLSDAKAGFEIKTTQRLAGIKILNAGTQLRRYRLSYETTEQSGGLSRLASVQRYGVGDEGPFPVAFSFGYSAGLGASAPVLLTMNGSLGIDFRAGTADFNDFNGDSLPDVVDTSGPRHRLFVASLDSNGHPQFASPVDSAFGNTTLKSKSVEMFDLDGDGHADLLDSLNGVVLWNRGSGDWSNDAQPTSLSFPDLAIDGDLRPIDYDNDRLVDVIHSDASSTWVYANRGNGRFEVVQTGVDAIGAGFTSDGIQLADMNGDGMQDVVRRASGVVAYRMNLGLGHFGDWIEVKGTPESATDEHWIDLNGDGLADWLSVQGDAVVYAINRNGAELLSLVTLHASNGLPIPERTAETSVRFVDMNGSGSTDIVWIDASGRVTYLELFPIRPNLLTQIDNGIGKTIALTYGTSTAHMQRDGGPTAWHYRLPHPILTLDSIVVRDALSGVEQVRSFRYSDGYYDGGEKQFRGFEQVVATTPGDESVELGRISYRYDVGASDRYHKGLLLTQAVTSQSALLSQVDNAYDDCTLTGIQQTLPAVRFVCQTSSSRTLQEGRPQAEWVTTEERYQYDSYGNKILISQLGVTSIGGQGCAACRDPAGYGAPCDASCRGDESYQSIEFVSPEATGGRWMLDRPARVLSYGAPGSAVYAERTYHYDGQPFVGLPRGQLTTGLVSRVEAKVSANTNDTVDLERYEYDRDGAVIESWDPNGNRRSFEYDPTGLLMTAENIHFDTAQPAYALRMEAAYDPLLDRLVRASSWMRVAGGATSLGTRATLYAYDAFGRLSGIAYPGDTLQAPSEQYSYELSARGSRIIKRTRSVKEAPADLLEVRCLDGLGRALQTRVLTEAGQYLVSGFKQFNVAGAIWKDYQAYTANSDGCDTSSPSTLYTEHFYDAIGRSTRAKKADQGIYGSASVVDTEYLPLRTTVHDELDTQPSSVENPSANTPTTTEVDGLGRAVAIERRLQSNRSIRTEVSYDELGELAGITDAAGNRKRQSRDLLGRVTSLNDPDSGAVSFTYDAAGNPIATTDARGVVLRAEYDATGRKLAEWQEGNEAGTRISYEYDALAGCEQCSNLEGLLARVSYPLSDDRSERGQELFGYDERSQSTYLARSIGGSKFEFVTSYDNAGRVVRTAYPAALSLEFTRDGAGRLRSVVNYASNIAYDGRGLLGSLSLANGATTTYGYDDLERLTSIDAVSSSGTRVQQLTYARDRSGNITQIADGTATDDAPSSNAAYTYDALYRLVEARLDPQGKRAETLQFAYDDVDNLLSKSSNLGGASRDHVGGYAYGQNGAGPHAATTAGTTSLAYDAAGHLISRDKDRFEWDFLGRMARASSKDGPVARFWYGSTSERIKKTEQGQTTYYLTPDFEVRDGVATLYVRVGSQRIAKVEARLASSLPDLAPVQLDGRVALSRPDGKITAGDAWIAQAGSAEVFVLEQARAEAVVDELLGASVRRLLGLPDASTAKASYFYNDHLGTTVAVTDAAGTVVERRAHYPYGLEREEQPSLEVSYGFTGKEYDASTGLTYFGARYYDPRIARWGAPDPLYVRDFERSLKNPGQSNPYGYVGATPTLLLDPTGFEGESGQGWWASVKSFFKDIKWSFSAKGQAGTASVDSTGKTTFTDGPVTGTIDSKGKPGGAVKVGPAGVTYDENGRLTGGSVSYGIVEGGVDGEGVTVGVGPSAQVGIGDNAKVKVGVKAAVKGRIMPNGSRWTAQDPGARLDAVQLETTVSAEAEAEIGTEQGKFSFKAVKEFFKRISSWRPACMDAVEDRWRRVDDAVNARVPPPPPTPQE